MSNSQVITRRTLLKGSAMAAAAVSVFSLENFLQMGQALAADPTDIDILNFALTLEHLEYAFYRDGLMRFAGEHDFDFLRIFGDKPENSALTYFGLIRDHEQQHVDTLTKTIQSLGGTPVGEAKYDFKYTDIYGFVKTAQALENTGVMAYDGAVALIQKPELKTAGATIATVEARHASYLNFINREVPFPASFDVPKTMQQILAIAGPFIVGPADTTQPGSTAQSTAQGTKSAGSSTSNGGAATAPSGGSAATAPSGGSGATATPPAGITATVGNILKTLVPTIKP